MLYDRIASAYKFILQCYIKPNILNDTDISVLQYRNPENYLPSENIYLGPAVALAFQNIVLTLQNKDIFRSNCISFLVECVRQIFVWFPFNSNEIKSLKHMTFLDPNNVKNTSTLGFVSASFRKFVNDPNELDREWRLFISNINIDKNKSVLTFWKDSFSILKGDDTLMYNEINNFVTGLLSLPHSS